MLKRKIYDSLLEWKTNKHNECLLVKGGRQVGKSYIIRYFGMQEYDSFYEINFLSNSDYLNIFDGSLEADEIYRKMSLYIDNFEIKGKTLIFLDEIQHCPNARTALKFLAIDSRTDVIASGSLLGLHYKEILSIPVGYERQMDMYSLDLEEFLWALGYDIKAVLKEYFDECKMVPEPINSKYLDLFRSFMVVGGMPEAVQEFVDNRNYQTVNRVQNKILNDYFSDIERYASVSDKPKIRAALNSMTIQLAQEYKKFKYSNIEKGGNGRKYSSSIDWLTDAGIISKINNVTCPEMPLAGYFKPDDFKLYMNDTGLLTCMYGFETQSMLIRGGLKGKAKGGIFENAIFSELQKAGHKLYYFKKENSEIEIEFICETEHGVNLIEVKSSNNSTASLNYVMKNFEVNEVYKLIDGNVGLSDIKKTYPHYMVMYI